MNPVFTYNVGVLVGILLCVGHLIADGLGVSAAVSTTIGIMILVILNRAVFYKSREKEATA